MNLNTQNKKFWQISAEETAQLLKTNIESGLSMQEVKNRLEVYGKNIFEKSKKISKLKIFLSQLKSPLIFILIIAGVITSSISHYRDAIFIFIAVAVNAILGFWQENKAENALSQLKKYLKHRTRVIREGKEQEISVEELVIGDIILLAQGDRVPADAKLSFVNDFQVDEAVLTGESLPIGKSVESVSESANIADQNTMVFAGTLVTQGICRAIVCQVGANTELGKIASLIAKTNNEKTPLQKAISKFSIFLGLLLGALTLVVFIIGIFSGKAWLEMFLTSVALAVSAIPEGLPISMTVVLAIGVERMARRKGVVRKLIAAETLGGTTVILTDKTGTLTMAKMMLSKIISFNLNENKLLTYALANANVLVENPEDNPELWQMNGRIMETTLVKSAGLRGISFSEISDKSHVLQAIPFNSAQKYSASIVEDKGEYLIVLFGAPDILLSQSSLSESDKKIILDQIDFLASSGERVLGLATKKIEYTEDPALLKDSNFSGLSFDGILTFRDPIRSGIKDVIERVRNAGIKTVIMTGDHRGTAIAVAKEIGLNTDEKSILDASELAILSDQALKERLPFLSVVSRVTPFDKLRIVRLFQELDEVVAMTGDGVNDAPSIKQANIGIAMGSGTEVSQSVADLVLLDDNFETIVAAVEEGRQILSNIRKVLVYLLSNVADGLILIGGSILVGVPLPLNALQILWVNFFTDSFPAIAFAFEKDRDGLSHKPNGKNMVLFNPLMKFLILVIGILTSVLLFVIYLVLLRLGFDPAMIKTFIFGAFGTYTLILALSVKSLEKSIFSYSLFSNKYLTGAIMLGLVLMAAAIYIPVLQKLFNTVALPINWLIGIILIGVLNIALIEFAKWIFRRFKNK
ncbi:MAG: HAD-IC family P-type ATPase [Planctomycetes bacterium]|jgi:Ca2+-transporting ATPase|nr:HAD-IC family P-type ATPase [Planctomycetota bacterium]